MICRSLRKVFLKKCFSIQNKWISILFSSTRFFNKFSRGHVQESFDVAGVAKYDFLVKHMECRSFTILQIFQKLEISIFIFKIYCHISWNQKNKTKQSACNNIKQKKFWQGSRKNLTCDLTKSCWKQKSVVSVENTKYMYKLEVRNFQGSLFHGVFLQTEMLTVWKLELLKTFDELPIYFSHIIYIYI